jgi:CBS domain-containing protein
MNQSKEMICPSCGHDNIPGSDECTDCFTSLTHEDIPPEEARDRVERSLLEDCTADLNPAEPISTPVDSTLEAAIEQMRSARVGCLLITDAAGRLAGILTERDLLNKIALEGVDLSSTQVGTVMTPDPETIESDRPLAYAVHLMTVGDLRHLPLVDDDGRAVGIISSRDIVDRIAALVGAT